MTITAATMTPTTTPMTPVSPRQAVGGPVAVVLSLVALVSGAVGLGLVTVGGAALAALAYVVAVRGRVPHGDAVPLPQH